MKKNYNRRYFDIIENNVLNAYYKIGYITEKGFYEIARYRNAYTKPNYAQYALLQVWLDDIYIGYAHQGGCNVCGGYNKLDANTEIIIADFFKERGIPFPGNIIDNSTCGYMKLLMKALQERINELNPDKIVQLVLIEC